MSIKSDIMEVLTTNWDTSGYQPGSFIDLVMKIYACACGQCDYYDDTIDTACSNSGFSIDTIIPDDTGLSDNTTQKIFQTIEAAMSFRAAMIGMDNFAWFDFSTEDADCTEAGYASTSPGPDHETLRIRIKTPMLEEYSDLSTEEVAAFDTLVSAQDFTSETYGTGSRRVITAGNSFSKAMGYLKAKKIEMDTYASSYGGTCAFSIDGIFEPPDGLPSKYSEYNLPGQLQTDKAYLCAKAILTGTPLGIVTFCICIKWHLCR